jgi:hypothetical protein
MLLPKNMNKKIKPFVYMVICSLHGFLFGTLFAPMQALFFNLDFNGTIAWIVAGLPYDAIHGVSNFFCGLLIVPIINVLKKVENGCFIYSIANDTHSVNSNCPLAFISTIAELIGITNTMTKNSHSIIHITKFFLFFSQVLLILSII